MTKKEQELAEHFKLLIENGVSSIAKQHHTYLRVYYDAEFTSLTPDGKLISIGLISESGAWFYAEFNDYDEYTLPVWVNDNVLMNLVFNDKDVYRHRDNIDDAYGGDRHNVFMDEVNYSIMMKNDPEHIRKDLLKWLSNEYRINHKIYPTSKYICFHTDAGHYDWMLLTSLICENRDGINLPGYISYAPLDLCSVLHAMGDISVDISREILAGSDNIRQLANVSPFNSRRFANIDLKHNSLWDAAILMMSCKRLMI